MSTTPLHPINWERWTRLYDRRIGGSWSFEILGQRYQIYDGDWLGIVTPKKVIKPESVHRWERAIKKLKYKSYEALGGAELSVICEFKTVTMRDGGLVIPGVPVIMLAGIQNIKADGDYLIITRGTVHAVKVGYWTASAVQKMLNTKQLEMCLLD